MHQRIKTTDLLGIALETGFLLSPGHLTVRLMAQLLSLLRKQEPYSAAVAEASSSLERADSLVDSLQTQIAARNQELEQLMADYETYRTLAAAKQEEAQAFLDELNKQLRQSSHRERIWAVIINVIIALVFFVGGLFLSPIVGIGH